MQFLFTQVKTISQFMDFVIFCECDWRDLHMNNRLQFLTDMAPPISARNLRRCVWCIKKNPRVVLRVSRLFVLVEENNWVQLFSFFILSWFSLVFPKDLL